MTQACAVQAALDTWAAICQLTLTGPQAVSQAHLECTLAPMLAKVAGSALPALRAAGCVPALLAKPPQRSQGQHPGVSTQVCARIAFAVPSAHCFAAGRAILQRWLPCGCLASCRLSLLCSGPAEATCCRLQSWSHLETLPGTSHGQCIRVMWCLAQIFEALQKLQSPAVIIFSCKQLVGCSWQLQASYVTVPAPDT